MKPMLALAVLFAFTAAPALADTLPALPNWGLPEAAPMSVAAAWSCNPRRTCGRIHSCEEAVWYYRNCSWGRRLDGDKDGVPCESLCR